MPKKKKFRIGIGAGDLAFEQWKSVEPRVEPDIVEADVIGLPGTVDHREVLIDRLLRGDLDAAVIPTRYLPTTLPEGVKIAAIPPRRTPLSALVTNDGIILDEFEEGAVIGVEGAIQMAQILFYRPELKVVVVRGAILDRLRKLDQEEIDALVVPAAYAEWLGIQERVSEILSVDVVMPVAGQGSLSFLVCKGDDRLSKMAHRLDEPMSRLEVMTERLAVSNLLEARSDLAGALARLQGDRIRLECMMVDPAGRQRLRYAADAPADDAKKLARKVSDAIIAGVSGAAGADGITGGDAGETTGDETGDAVSDTAAD